MNLKSELQKMNITDLKSICLELGIKYNGNKHKTIENILKPLNNKYKWSSIRGCFKCGKKNKYNKLQQDKKKIELEDPELKEYWKNVKEKSKFVPPDFSNFEYIDAKQSPNLVAYSNSKSPTGFSIIGNSGFPLPTVDKPVSPATINQHLFSSLRRRNSSSNF